jgi:hypothetical protein
MGAEKVVTYSLKLRAADTGLIFLSLASWLAYVCYVPLLAYHGAGIVASDIPSPCIFKWGTGLPCPFCGVTRSLASLIRGDFKEALFYHPLSVPLFLLYTYSILRLVRNLTRDAGPSLSRPIVRVWCFLAVISWIIKFVLPKNYW